MKASSSSLGDVYEARVSGIDILWGGQIRGRQGRLAVYEPEEAGGKTFILDVKNGRGKVSIDGDVSPSFIDLKRGSDYFRQLQNTESYKERGGERFVVEDLARNPHMRPPI